MKWKGQKNNMDFKVGDKIKGLRGTGYAIVNENMLMGEVIKVSSDGMLIKILKHTNEKFNDKDFFVENSKKDFALVNEEKIFFKRLPSDFTGTLEIENGYIVEHKEILDKVEKEYLENFLRPFKEEVKEITKIRKAFSFQNEMLHIGLKDIGSYDIILPDFKKGTMYKGMELYEAYTLQELGLFKEETNE